MNAWSILTVRIIWLAEMRSVSIPVTVPAMLTAQLGITRDTAHAIQGTQVILTEPLVLKVSPDSAFISIHQQPLLAAEEEIMHSNASSFVSSALNILLLGSLVL